MFNAIFDPPNLAAQLGWLTASAICVMVSMSALHCGRHNLYGLNSTDEFQWWVCLLLNWLAACYRVGHVFQKWWPNREAPAWYVGVVAMEMLTVVVVWYLAASSIKHDEEFPGTGKIYRLQLYTIATVLFFMVCYQVASANTSGGVWQ